jgi:hypothetical protein
MEHLPMMYEQSMDWGEALETLRESYPELTAQLDVLDRTCGPNTSISTLPKHLHPIANLTEPLTLSLH